MCINIVLLALRFNKYLINNKTKLWLFMHFIYKQIKATLVFVLQFLLFMH